MHWRLGKKIYDFFKIDINLPNTSDENGIVAKNGLINRPKVIYSHFSLFLNGILKKFPLSKII